MHSSEFLNFEIFVDIAVCFCYFLLKFLIAQLPVLLVFLWLFLAVYSLRHNLITLKDINKFCLMTFPQNKRSLILWSRSLGSHL